MMRSEVKSIGDWCIAILFLPLLVSCSPLHEPPVVSFDAEHYPQHLSAWGIVNRQNTQLVLGRQVIPYDLNTPLFTDYAHKLRTLWMPPGETASYEPEDVFRFPVGTIISKTFYYPRNDRNDLIRTQGCGARPQPCTIDRNPFAD